MEEQLLAILKRVFKLESIDNTISQESCPQWDSMNHLILVVEIEIEFGCTFSPEEIAEMKSFASIVNILKSK